MGAKTGSHAAGLQPKNDRQVYRIDLDFYLAHGAKPVEDGRMAAAHPGQRSVQKRIEQHRRQRPQGNAGEQHWR